MELLRKIFSLGNQERHSYSFKGRPSSSHTVGEVKQQRGKKSSEKISYLP